MSYGKKRSINPGDRFGKLVIIRELNKKKLGVRRFETLCDCGNLTIKTVQSFCKKVQYCSNSCRLLPWVKNPIDLIGKKFGRWTVISVDKDATGKNGRRWICVCECGSSGSVLTHALVSGHSKSCGCLRGSGQPKKYFTCEERIEANRRACRNYVRNNPAKLKAKKISRSIQEGYATPLWLNKSHWHEMNKFYIRARRLTRQTKVAHHVDHIIPLQGDTVCGLHVPWNLQVLTRSENSRKSNKISQSA